VVDDRPCGLGSAAEICVDLEIGGRLLGRVFKAELLESSQRTRVGNLVELTSDWIDYPTFLFCLAHSQTNEADSTTMGFNNSNDACGEAWWNGRLGTEREDKGPALTGRFFDDRKPESFSEFDERSRTEGENSRQKVDDKMVMKDRIADLRLQLAGGRQLARCRDAMQEDQLHRRTVTAYVATAQ
jgi:hypothetical protein